MFGTTLVILTAIDFAVHRLPNKVLSWASLVGLVLFTLAALVRWDVRPFLHGVEGMFLYGIPMIVIGIVSGGNMGWGDVKFAPYLGFHLGWLRVAYVPLGAFMGFLFGALVGVLLVTLGSAGRKTQIAFGPYMALGALVCILAGDVILRLWFP
jgi:leader peptidase (prepilin peptidase)/N-methyltransferase